MNFNERAKRHWKARAQWAPILAEQRKLPGEGNRQSTASTKTHRTACTVLLFELHASHG